MKRTCFRVLTACLLSPLLQSIDVHSQDFRIGLNFTGMLGANNTFSGGSPPDTMGAVGPTEIIEMLNATYSVYDKFTGGLISRFPSKDLWHDALVNNNIAPGDLTQTYDPRIIYDHSSQRWFATAVTRPDETARLLVGVSNTSHWLDGWKAVSFDASSLGIEPGEAWADFPRLGVDADGVYISLFTFEPPTPVRNAWISIPKADLLGATPTIINASAAFHEPLGSNGDYSTLTPTIDFGPSKGRSPIIIDKLNSTQLAYLTNVLGPGPAQISPSITIATNLGEPFAVAPHAAPQPGTSTLISTASAFEAKSSSVSVGDSIWYVRTIDQGGRSAIRWLEIDGANDKLLQSGIISDPDLFLYDASIAVNEFGDAVIGFTGSSSNQFASAYASVGRTVDGTTSFSDLTLLRSGLAPFSPIYAGPLRWGDYSATVLDPENPRIFWTFQEFASPLTPSIDSNNWGIQITQIILDDLPGDFDLDGDVDGHDFLIWQRNPSVGNLADWQANYGTPALSHFAVPEPSAQITLLLCIMAMFARTRPRKENR